MNFNSVDFFIFFLVFYLLYWTVFKSNKKIQNLFILIGSYLFYAHWDWRFLALIALNTLVNYFLALKIEKEENEKKQKIVLYSGLLFGLGVLGFFKYYNFFVQSFIDGFSIFGLKTNLKTLQIILPLGISYYTFRTLSYLLDVDKGKIKPTENLLVFANFVSFFPSIVAGPIDKAQKLIPQFENKRTFNYSKSVDGLKQILWGAFKKIVIADNLASLVAKVFDNYETLPASLLVLGTFLYAIQLYADFSGYSDMALGVARLLGFEITKNFDFPFFAQNIAEFWKKWHISLTSWLTEYVYTPLSISFRYYGDFGTILAILINFTIVGFWHGANWNCILFGFVHGLYFIPLVLKGTVNKRRKKDEPIKFKNILNMLGVFSLVMFTFIIFRASTISDSLAYYGKIFSSSFFSIPLFENQKTNAILIVNLGLILFLFVAEWFGRKDNYGIEKIGQHWRRIFRWFWYAFIVFLIGMYAHTEETAFIYFQF